jgi:hypothetical protein
MTPVRDEIVDFERARTPAEIRGYLAKGGFARDLHAWFGGRPPGDLDRDAKRMAKKLARLPEPHRAAAIALDALATGKAIPSFRTFAFDAYGFDPVKNELYGASDPRYVGLANDESGSYQLLDLPTGKVVSYEHEEGTFEEPRSFADLDTWAYCMLRVELVAEKRLAKTALRAHFEKLGLETGVFELDSWVHGGQ